jgi:hypothetical protein
MKHINISDGVNTVILVLTREILCFIIINNLILCNTHMAKEGMIDATVPTA